MAVFSLMPRRLLVVVTTDVSDGTLSEFVRRAVGEDAEVRAGALADKTAEAAPAADVQAEVGDADPVRAIEDALREFPADEVLVVTRPDEDASWLESGSGEIAQNRFRLPVRHVTVAEDGSLISRSV